MAGINDKTETELEKISSDFKAAMKLCKSIFGKEAFRKVYKDYDRLPPINKAIFDALSVQFALLSETERRELKDKKVEMKVGFKSLLANDERFFISVTSSTGDKNRVIYRHKAVENLIKSIIHN